MDDLNTQLFQMKAALLLAADEDKPALESIIRELEELVGSFGGGGGGGEQRESDNPPASNDDDEMDEFSRFQAEIAALESTQSSETNMTSCSSTDPISQAPSTSPEEVRLDETSRVEGGESISDELAALEGMKCLAPHEESWGQIGFYPAMISQILGPEDERTDPEESEFESMDSIMVKVVFLQPVVKSQRLCPFYQEDKCRFDDADCRFSHGEVVPLAKLREYSDPDYSKVIPGARVLAKHLDDLWYKATITRLTTDGNCEVEFDLDKEICEIAIHETSPVIDGSNEEDSSSEDESDFEGVDDSTGTENSSLELLSSDDILKVKASEALGDWEKYTKGIGSKIMMRMGYVMGSGLGRKAEGRIIPVDAVMVPQGMSLDKFMNLKEKAGGNSNLFSVEKRLKKAQRKHAAQQEKIASRKQGSHSVFDFMNNKLSHNHHKQQHSSKKLENHPKLTKQSANHLKKNMLHVGENMRKVCKEIRKVQESMKRIEGRDKQTHSKMKEKLDSLQKERDNLAKLESNIVNEQKNRSDKRKLTEF